MWGRLPFRHWFQRSAYLITEIIVIVITAQTICSIAVMDAQGSDSKSLVCEACWNSIFSFDAWQTVIAATNQPLPNHPWGYSKGYCYDTTWEAIHASASADCSWCQLLAQPKFVHGSVEIWVAYDKDSECTPAGTKQLTVKAEGSEGGSFSFQHYMYTDAGMWV